MNKVGKILLYLSSIIFASLFLSLFLFNESKGLIIKDENLLFSEGSGRAGSGSGSGPTKISLVSYTYKVQEKVFTGLTLRFYGGHREIYSPEPLKREKISVYYLKMVPGISIVDRATSLYTAVVLLLFGLGLIEVSKWLKNIRKR